MGVESQNGFRKLALAGAVAGLFTLSGCGGGGGESSSTTAVTSPTVESTSFTILGTAATGKAIVGAVITAKCAEGTGTATTDSNGLYTMEVSAAKLPCLLELTNPVDNTKLHAIATGSGNLITANITPLTELQAARVLRVDPTAFSAAIATSAITLTTLKNAQVDVGVILSGIVDTSGLIDFVSTPLKAATESDVNNGDAQDKILDALSAKLSSTQRTLIADALARGESPTDIQKSIDLYLKGIRPNIGWEVSISPAIYTYVMQLCYGQNQCSALGGSILMDVDPYDNTMVQGTANGINYGDVTREELQQIIDQGTEELNTIIANLWNGRSTPSDAEIQSVFNTALASASSPEDLVSRVTEGFVKKGYPSAAGNTIATAESGYLCATTKITGDTDWIQSHSSYWAAMNAHDQSLFDLEKQYCDYALPACLVVATHKADCPG